MLLYYRKLEFSGTDLQTSGQKLQAAVVLSHNAGTACILLNGEDLLSIVCLLNVVHFIPSVSRKNLFEDWCAVSTADALVILLWTSMKLIYLVTMWELLTMGIRLTHLLIIHMPVHQKDACQ